MAWKRSSVRIRASPPNYPWDELKCDILYSGTEPLPFISVMEVLITVADGYLFTILSWAPWTKVDYSKHKNMAAYISRIGERPAVLKTIQIEESLSA